MFKAYCDAALHSNDGMRNVKKEITRKDSFKVFLGN